MAESLWTPRPRDRYMGYLQVLTKFSLTLVQTLTVVYTHMFICYCLHIYVYECSTWQACIQKSEGNFVM